MIDTRSVARGLRELPPRAERIALAGDWRFAPGAAINTASESTTRVPGHVVFDGLVPDDGIATLWRSVTIPDAWSEGAVFVRFDGAYGQATVTVNGEFAGSHGSGATSFDLDITGLVRPGENTIAITLVEYGPHSVIDYMSWYAHMSLLGIWRDVFVFRTHLAHLGRVDAVADWDSGDGMGSLTLGFDLLNLSPVRFDGVVRVSVEDDGSPVSAGAVEISVAAAGGSVGRLELTALEVRPWSAEDPRRYLLRIEVLNAGVSIQSYQRMIGFRRVQVVGNELHVNGTPIRVLGVNRHDARMNSGRALTTQQFRDDVMTFRQANVNTIRTSHYPADPRLADICDELGMYLFDEPPICWMGFLQWNKAHQAAHLSPFLLEVTAETVRRDSRHPSVIVWDLANESEWSGAFAAQLNLVRQLDPSRPTIFSFDLNAQVADNPLATLLDGERPELHSYHYPGLEQPWAKDLERFAGLDRPVICDEYIPIIEACQRFPHEAYVLPIDPGVRDYWVTAIKPFMAELFRTRSCIGGMVWSGIDDLFAIPLDYNIGEGAWSHLPLHEFQQQRDLFSDGTTFFRGDGEWGVLDAWGRPRAEHWHLAKMYSPIEVGEPVFDPDASAMSLTVHNRFSHVDLERLEVVAHYDASEEVVALSARPGESVEVRLAVPATTSSVQLRFVHPEGWVVDGFTWMTPWATGDVRASLRLGAEEATIAWPKLHVQSADRPDIPVTLPIVEVGLAAENGARIALISDDWAGWISARRDGAQLSFDYECTFTGGEPFNAREVGLTFAAPHGLTDLWWRREGEWSYYPPTHIGRNAGYATPSPRPIDVQHPTVRWEDDGAPTGSTDYRSAKRDVFVAGLTDGARSFSVIAAGSQSVRAELQPDGAVLHVLDWYGGVRTMDPVHPVWSEYFGAGKRIEPGTVLSGSITVMVGRLLEGVRV